MQGDIDLRFQTAEKEGKRMNETLHRAAENYAQMALEWLDIDAHVHRVKRADLMELFIDTLRAMNQTKEQEE